MHRSTRLLALLAALGFSACADDPTTTPTLRPAADHAAAHARAAAPSAEVNRQLAELRRVTTPFHDLDRAIAAGYSIQVTPCWASSSGGAMGYHYGNVPPEEWDLSVDVLAPELLMYEPAPGGRMRLVGMEYVVPKLAWDAVHDSPPTLLGQEFHPHSSLPIYKLHLWLWRENPRGIFADWNPNVSCERAAETQYFP
jgi:hypothetical protein